ncbi:hypothetical protein PC129_g1459 [Phytophthora cactorum]|uniref:Uncharacterized protein n=1 Tax=Phytophthora cactorum TaxID=29920 RepID=A0A8T1ECC4_9STRA|nr:hypothetical protein Pcac1_g10979 [Phytophthora cactorum]KAG2847782.1 hypothetical protein PC111_g677 [Phytophthora cactorum]KAG2849814.1 hypothetical protein PC112_g25 [Phytophthora cactorum]KAG2869269.1 hypothetical protein PC113_g276 [Phytophthora cactorum]KAG2936350.1 hypothetical protein PC114_g299 [Phytophthora cactorum]
MADSSDGQMIPTHEALALGLLRFPVFRAHHGRHELRGYLDNCIYRDDVLEAQFVFDK